MSHEHPFDPQCKQCLLRVQDLVTPSGEFDEHEQKCVADIQRYGCHIIHVLPDEGDDGFAYSIGLYANYGSPELVVFGQKDEWQKTLINALKDDIRSGTQFAAGDISTEYIPPDYPLLFRAVPSSAYREFFGWARWFYGTFYRDAPLFPVLQCVWPDLEYRWPWQEGFASYIQPVIDLYEWVRDENRMRPVLKPFTLDESNMPRFGELSGGNVGE